MTNRSAGIIASALSVLACAGCATPGDDQSAEYREQKIYRTGSNIAVKDYGAENIEVRSGEIVNPVNRPMGPFLGRKPGG
jgi:hypothetical protein